MHNRFPAIWKLQLNNSLVGFSQFLFMTLTLTVLSAEKASALWIGTAMTLVNVVYSLLTPFTGRIADRLGRPQTALIGLSIAITAGLFAHFFTDGISLTTGLLFMFAGCAFFFPSNAGLFSDAADTSLRGSLHKRVSGYNLGWSSGNLAGFMLFGLLAVVAVKTTFWLLIAALSLCAILLLPYLRLKPRPPAPTADRAFHPALPIFISMGRINLLICCMIGMALFTQLEKSLNLIAPALQARQLTGITLSGYSCGCLLMFTLLGRSSNWILKPWHLTLYQTAYLPGALALLLAASYGWLNFAVFFAAGIFTGLAFGASYTGSLYYSLRTPDNASRASGLHETHIGIGNSLGPAAAGVFLWQWQSAQLNSLAGLGLYMSIIALLALGYQAVMINSRIKPAIK